MNDEQIKELVEKTGFELVETHISWILLGDYAYKIKKPVKFSFLDFTTLEKRRYFCEEEVRLNKRLSPDMYLGVVPVSSEGIGRGNEDYAVKMKKMPKDRTMDILLEKGDVGKEHIEAIAAIVAQFHKKIETIKGRKYSSADVVKSQIDDLGNFREVIEQACGLGKEVDYILERSYSFISENKERFEKRQEEGMIKDCHGDLHSANIFITDKITIFDCIEFSKDFRYVDTASEIAFMAMDLDAFGKEDYSKIFVEQYLELSNDSGLEKMLGIYKCYRANVRAKIAAIDHSQHPGEESKERMRKYTELAQKYAKEIGV